MKRFLVALSALFLIGCGESEQTPVQRVLPWAETKELVVLVQNGPTSLYVNAAGDYAGLEYDLVSQFAQANNLKIRFLVSGNYTEMLERLQRREAHLAVGGVKSDEQGLIYGAAYQQVEPVLVFSSKISEEGALAAIKEGRAGLSTLPQYVMALNQLKVNSPELNWHVLENTDNESLIEQVAQGKLDYALVDSHAAEVAQNYYPNIAISRQMGEKQSLAWAMPDAEVQLQMLVEGFFRKQVADGTLRRLQDRYYGHVNRVDPLDALAYLGRIESTLPRYKNWFQEAEARTGMDWRLIAALSYQESHWNPDAVSPTGVRGMMMLTSETADRMNVDRTNPYQSIIGGAKYIQMLKETLADRAPEPDRTWLALAAYNIGMGHLIDARTLAVRMKKDPNSWADVKSVLPLLRKPEYFRTLKYGYARGGEPVIFVESLQSYYDILARFERPSKTVLPMPSDSIVVQNPNNLQLEINSVLKPQQNAKVAANW
ncbi:membrane-bound lytic murein transglycosylase MltF [Chitinibacter bivalviorum]|uniref:Membrane-bound lytic murein transglycosylase MltF n=1 Tax=Chitinibacter bivalviorum TaxID=2739434 RepID=A0A7H9BJF0_9NEIS|nr:membrane-bound lytic murein transglycosylase MltF [Chitinibacter bivalviorum]QLG88502.1 membrane-bound lytic murein transglycosylase MltF [Chitinibacter bivalviorum]